MKPPVSAENDPDPLRAKRKRQSPVEAFDERLITALLRAATGETITFYAEPSGAYPPRDPSNPNRVVPSGPEAWNRMRQLIKMQLRINMLRKRMRETNHPLASQVYRAEVALYRFSWPRTREAHPKSGSLEIRPADSNLSVFLDQIGPRASASDAKRPAFDASFLEEVDEPPTSPLSDK